MTYHAQPAIMDIQRPGSVGPTPGDFAPSPPPPPQQQPVNSGGEPTPDQTPQPTSPKTGKNKGKLIAIILIVVVVLSLIGAAIFMYLRSRESVEPAPAAQTPTEEVPVADDGHVDPEDIDASTQQIDSSLTQLNDSSDFGADDLTDNTIGL